MITAYARLCGIYVEKIPAGGLNSLRLKLSMHMEKFAKEDLKVRTLCTQMEAQHGVQKYTETQLNLLQMQVEHLLQQR